MKKRRLLAALIVCAATVGSANALSFEEVGLGETLSIGNDTVIQTQSTSIAGSAIMNNAGNVTIGDNVSFTNNTTLQTTYDTNMNQMGTIYSEGKASVPANLTIGNNVLFQDNRAGAGAGLYLFGNNNVSLGDNAKFISNTTHKDLSNLDIIGSGGGAISLVGRDDVGNPEITIGNEAVFDSNKANWGGAINVSSKDAKLTIGDDAQFTNNTADGSFGGAIYNAGYTQVGQNAHFGSNNAKQGGAIFNDRTANFAPILNASFTNNTASLYGGAIATRANLEVGGMFMENSATQGGAIYNVEGAELKIADNSSFHMNSATITGSAISNYNSDIVIRDNVSFTSNIALQESYDSNMNQMGTIYSEGTASHTNNITIGENVTFSDNVAGAGAGLYLFGANNVTIGDGAKFENNITQKDLSNPDLIGGGGGAITLVNNGSNGNVALTIGKGAIFNGNKASYGGAINLNSTNTSITIGDDAQFIGNIADGSFGGAIYNQGTTTIGKNALFQNNSALKGGAIFNQGGANPSATLNTIEGAIFDGNNAVQEGGAIATRSDIVLDDCSFTNNTANVGGAIYSEANIVVNAKNSDVLVSGNTDSTGANDITMNSSASKLSLNAAEGRTLTLESGVNGTTGYQIAINSNGLARTTNYTGSVIIDGIVNNATISVDNGTLALTDVSNIATTSSVNVGSNATLNTINNKIETIGNNINLADGAKIEVDLDAATGAGDNYSTANIEGSVVINEINTISGNTDATNLSKLNIAEALGLTNVNVTVSDAARAQTYSVMTPIQRMNGIIDSNGMMTFAPAGSGYKNFNPAVMSSAVGAQLGGYLTQLNAYNQAFHNMDTYMLMTKNQRKAMKMASKVACSACGVGVAHKGASMWANPYTTFEKVNLNDGPKVSNVGYGMFFGGESDMHDLGNGWDGVFGAYAGYNGSHQSFDGVSIYQNGGSLGLVGMAYKDNFFTGLTINAGANAAQASTKFGNEDFSMLMAGIASKSGYNFEFKEGKVILQPSMLMSYTMVNTFDYTNAAGVSINSDPLHALQLEPGLKIIGNLNNGWQPYASVSMIWNIMDKTQFTANDVSLPSLSVKPYVKYGVGVRKSFGERLSGFFQTYITNGGRNGVGLQLGFRCLLGKNR